MRSATIEIFGVPHAYEITGPKTTEYTIIFIHGWLNSRGYWQPVIERLQSDIRCLSYDLRGFGESQPKQKIDIARDMPISSSKANRTPPDLTVTGRKIPDNPFDSFYTPSAYVEDLVVLLQQLNLDNVWLIGHSLGGTIALWAADRMPQEVKGVICINSGGGIYLKESFEKFRTAGQRFLQFRPKWLSQVPLIDLLFARNSVARPLEPQWARQRIMDFVVADPQAALGALLDSTTEEEINYLPQLVSQLKQPVYFLAGAEDKVMEPKYVRHLASFHPLFKDCGDNTIEIPNCGHLAMLEQPDIVAERIRSIIN